LDKCRPQMPQISQMDTKTFPGKLAIQQRVLTTYRAPLFDALAQSCAGELSVFAGLPRQEEFIATADQLKVAIFKPAHNIHILRGLLYFCFQRGIVSWLSDWNPDALIVEANPRYLSTPGAIRWMKRNGKPVIGWGLGAPPSSSPHFLQKWGESQRKAFLNHFDALLTYSRRGADEYAALGFPADRIFVAPNAASPRPILPLPSRPNALQGAPCILFVGRLQVRKRVNVLLRACTVQPVKPRLVIVGDGPERASLEALAKTIYPSAEFVGEKHGSELAPYFLAADLFVLPGTGGLAVQEAMSYGLPVIMGQGDGTNDDLVRPGNGWQLPGPDALADILREALADVSRLRAMGAESYRIVAEEINLENMVGVFMDAVKSITR
jgi:glycosyltransferase involved in cell wall biosynthesis